MAIRLADTARPNNHVDAEHLGTFPVAYAEDVWFGDGTRLSEKTFDGTSIQKEELPLASATELGNIYQYIGETGTYTKGYFYECVSDGESTPTYSWKEIKFAGNVVKFLEDDIYMHFDEFDEDAVIVYSGEDTPSQKKGHHYKKVVGETTDMYRIQMYEDPEGATSTSYYILSPEIEIGTILFSAASYSPRQICVTKNNNSIVAYDYVNKNSQTYQYGYVINNNPESIALTGWIDIGGGDAVGGIIDVETLPTTDIKNTFYRLDGQDIQTEEYSFLIGTFKQEVPEALVSYGFTLEDHSVGDDIDMIFTIDKETELYSGASSFGYIDKFTYVYNSGSTEIKFYLDSTLVRTDTYGANYYFVITNESSYYAGNETKQTTEKIAKDADLQKIFIGTQAEWDALTTDKKLTYKQVNITDDDSGANLDYYSTSETKTNKVWIDGKPIYRRVIYYWWNGAVVPDVTLSNSIYSGDAVPENISDLIDAYMVSYRPTGDADVIKSNGVNGGSGAFVPNIINRTAYFGNGGYNPTKACAIFEYTKTTD